MSQWINKDAFGKFQEQKKEEKANTKSNFGIRRSDFVWDTPLRGTETVAKEYIGRFLADPNDVFYRVYYYHMFYVGDKWFFDLCPKTFDFESYCPICSITQKLWTGTAADKKSAYNYKRKMKYVGNWYVVKDNRDEDKEDDDKVAGTVKLYEFPGKVEMKLKEELTDAEEGLGYQIFDPGKEGHNFILKVLSTKPTPEGDTWPDYAQSLFSRKASALGTDKEIEEIMRQRIDIEEYVQGLKKPDDELEKTLKDEMILDLVKDEWYKIRNKENEPEKNGIVQKAQEHLKNEPDDIDDSKMELPETLKKEIEKEEGPETETKDKDESPFKDDDDSDAALLKELEDL